MGTKWPYPNSLTTSTNNTFPIMFSIDVPPPLPCGTSIEALLCSGKVCAPCNPFDGDKPRLHREIEQLVPPTVPPQIARSEIRGQDILPPHNEVTLNQHWEMTGVIGYQIA